MMPIVHFKTSVLASQFIHHGNYSIVCMVDKSRKILNNKHYILISGSTFEDANKLQEKYTAILPLEGVGYEPNKNTCL